MELGQIVLRETNFAEFAKWKERWDKVKPYQDYIYYAAIQTPLTYQSYEEAIHDFFQHKDAQGISVFDKTMPEGSKWRRLFKNDLNDSNIDKLIGVYASAARAQIKKRVFEMKFGSGYQSFDLLIMSFSSFGDNRIVSTCIEAPYIWTRALNIPGDKPRRYQDRMMAVWTPE